MDPERFCEANLEKVFYFCLRKTGSEHDAEELAGEIFCEALTALRRGAKPASFQAWFWAVARNRWARWARGKYGAPTVDIDTLSLPDAADVEGLAVTADELRRLRRALAFIRAEYRTILVAHYFEDKSVATIARENGIPLGTVKTRLIRSRRILREGMDMAKEFGRRSFAPENIDLTNEGRFGDRDQPWSILEHLLYLNIFLEAYGNPSTAEELSLALGVALPYMEQELEFLTGQTFLAKDGDRYQTAFPIISREARERIGRGYRELTPELTKLMTEEIDLFCRAAEGLGECPCGPWASYEDAKWTLLMRAVDRHFGATDTGVPQPRPQRPDHGEWNIIGFEQLGDTYEPWFVGLHDRFDRRTEESGLPDAAFSSYRFIFRHIQDRTPHWYSHRVVAAYQAVVLRGGVRPGEDALCDAAMLDSLAEEGLVRKDGDRYVPNTVVFVKDAADSLFSRFPADVRQTISAKARRIEELIRDLRKATENAVDDDLPAFLREQPGIREFAYGAGSNERGYVLEEAFRTGWLRDDDHTAKTIGMFLMVDRLP